MGKLTGWHTLNLDDVLPTVSTALRLYERNRPALKMRSRRHNLPDGVTEWRIRCDGKPIGSVTLRKPTSGVIFGYAIAPGARGKMQKNGQRGISTKKLVDLMNEVPEKARLRLVVEIL